MDFIIAKFLHMVSRDYGFNWTKTDNPNGTYTCCITGIPADLKNILVKLKYSFVISVKEIKDSKGNIIRTEDVMSHNPVCVGIHNPDTGIYGIRVTFGENDYANKVNKLDYELRRYYETHSRIDEINNKY